MVTYISEQNKHVLSTAKAYICGMMGVSRGEGEKRQRFLAVCRCLTEGSVLTPTMPDTVGWDRGTSQTSISHSCLLWVAGGLQILTLEIKEKVDAFEKIFKFMYLAVSG